MALAARVGRRGMALPMKIVHLCAVPLPGYGRRSRFVLKQKTIFSLLVEIIEIFLREPLFLKTF